MIVDYGIKRESDNKDYEPPVDSHEEFLCKEWLEKYAKSKRVNKIDCINSYGLKHKIENQIGQYVSNGACIQAADDLGFKYWIGEDSINANFYMQLLLPEDEWKRIRPSGFSGWLFKQTDYALSIDAKRDYDWPRKASTFMDFWQYLKRWEHVLDEFCHLWERWIGSPAPRPDQIDTDAVYEEECDFINYGMEYPQAEDGFTYLYALVETDSRNSSLKVRYVGQTIKPAIRLRQHVLQPGTIEKVKWVGSLLNEGKYPKMAIFEKVVISEAKQKEKAAIYAFSECETLWDKEINEFRPIEEALLNINY